MSLRRFLAAKIHRATVTAADLEYEGSLTVPPELLDAAGILPYESVHIWNTTRGSRLETYAIAGAPGSIDVCANGAAAHLIFPGDKIIIASFTWVSARKAHRHKPRLVFVDDSNRVLHQGPEIPGPHFRSSLPRALKN